MHFLFFVRQKFVATEANMFKNIFFFVIHFPSCKSALVRFFRSLQTCCRRDRRDDNSMHAEERNRNLLTPRLCLTLDAKSKSLSGWCGLLTNVRTAVMSVFSFLSTSTSTFARTLQCALMDMSAALLDLNFKVQCRYTCFSE